MFWDADTDTGVRHEALFYGDTDELLAGAVPFVELGLAAGESVLVAVPEGNRRALEAALEGAGERVRFAPMEQLGRNPARIIPFWREFVEGAARAGMGARGIGEPIWPGRSRAELAECERHEALLNLAFADAPAWSLMCPYNTSQLDDRVLDRAAANHPVLREGVESAISGPYAPALTAEQVFSGALEPPSDPPTELLFGPRDLGRVRRTIGELAAAASLPRRRIEDAVLAANELATNSIRHGGGSGLLRLWRDGATVVCEVRDQGRFHDPLVGRVRPGAEQVGGRGLWIVNQICDLVQIRSAEGGSVVRLRAAAPGVEPVS